MDPVYGNGNPVEAFIYNGTTYLTIRAVSDALGKAALWDGETKSVYIGKHSSEKPVARLIDMDYFYNEGGDSWHSIKATGIEDNIGDTHYDGINFTKEGYIYCEVNRVYLINDKPSKFNGTIALADKTKSTNDKVFIKI